MKCSTCKKDKPESEFYWRNEGKKIRKHLCKTCSSDYRREHYEKNREKYIRKAHIQNKKAKKTAKEYVLAYIQDHPCVDCGNSDIRVLEFDHTKDKEDTIANMVHRGRPIYKIIAEIEKCEVRCANCHKIRHFNGGFV